MNLKKVANIVAVLLLIAIVVPFVIYSVPAVVGADYSFVVLTASMTPAIAPGDVVIVAERDSTTISTGDVITFTRGTSEVPVTHRVTAVTETGGQLAFETKGDANSDPDASAVRADAILGTVILSIPFIGYVIQFTNTPTGFITLVVVPIGLLVASELWTLYRGRSQKPTVAAESTAEQSNETATASTNAIINTPPTDTSRFVITQRTLEGAFGPLAVLVIYSGYIASVELSRGGLTAVTIAVVMGSILSVGMLSVLLVQSRRQATAPKSAPTNEPATNGELLDANAEQPDTDPEASADGGFDQPTDNETSVAKDEEST